MSEFLDRVQASASLESHAQALDAVRGVFYALFRGLGNGHGREETRNASDHLPEELETLWKPALFACLGEDRAGGRKASSGEAGGGAFVDRVRRQAPDLDGDGVERVARAVLGELRPLVPADGRAALARGLPDHLRDDWTG